MGQPLHGRDTCCGAVEFPTRVMLGQFPDRKPVEGFGRRPLEEVFDGHVQGLKILVFSGAMFGHVRLKFSLVMGLPLEIAVDQAIITRLQAAVR